MYINIKCSKLKYIKCILLNFMMIIIYYKLTKSKNIKVCVCTIGKEENKYIKEFIEHYKKYRIDKIFLYDNNNIAGEKFDNILKDFSKDGFIEIQNWRGLSSPQMMFYQDCYNKNYDKYDWLIFNDIDEFIFLKKFYNIKDFLNQFKFKKCESIQLSWLFRTDNNLIYYENKSLKQRFIEKDPYANERKIDEYSNGKSILKGHIKNIKIMNFHCISNKLKSCDGFGRKKKIFKPDNEYYYFDHYYSKSTEEFIEKLKKGDVYKGKIEEKIIKYFNYNKITIEKIKYLAAKLFNNSIK